MSANCRSACCDEQRTIERFRARYASPATRAERAIERAAIGANVGANGYTTVAQAAELGRALALRPGVRLLDLGCGRGYPGLYLAQTTGCSVAGSDLPPASLRLANERARRERLTRRSWLLAASAVQPPFRAESFDAIVHTDVLCCLRPKLAVLRACHRLLRPGGRMAFTTIYIAPGVSARDYRRAQKARGPGVAERRAMTELAATAGFDAVHERDVSAEFARTTRAYLDAAAPVERALRAAWGDARLDAWLRDRRATLRLIEEGVVRRGFFTARRAR
jgi:cyclopropane fatty-acyl-phospholipid synthase-like methyltransferase